MRHFSSRNKFYVYDKEKSQPRLVSVVDYACERFFYDVDFGILRKEILEVNPESVFDLELEDIIQSIDEQHIEHWFGENVESWLFNPIDRIITTYTMCNPQKLNSVSVLTDMEMDYLSMYIAIQVVRSKEFRERMTEMYEGVPLLLMKKMVKTQEEKNAIDSVELKINSENYKKLLHAQILMDPEIIEKFAETIRGKMWMVDCNQTDVPFITSDNPIVRFGHQGMQGFNSKGSEIFFPLNTKLVLVLRDPEAFWYEEESYNHFINVSRTEVEYYNSLQIQQNYRYIFNNSGDFTLISGMIKKESYT